ncbi:Pyridoxal-5'-phosphate-dependent protein beta subunit [Chthoniobacter flavus Ellin428]|uniref:Pyridoxal-5'-phosphate-dependent protein beta subunit n=1 Tax=Chthoniobacter flavus Ellin428 TaxID=497964 RepID=B4CXL8_9BACT|nr:pyridoxal-phosphate dependent enzyme [Chthoniobacter flavus]EDY21016.1 Pyridoxal-5'-phosphate-dependent protein beta subunit [Chthoniobacter flavus Ellin428]TCO88741.1 cysteine synthase A [Chthoniobacter flavus]
MIAETPLHAAENYHPPGNLFVKLEGEQPTGSIKHRAAVFMLEATRRELQDAKLELIESTSGNLGVALGSLAPHYGYELLCIVDQLIPSSKLDRLQRVAKIQSVPATGHSDARAARIALAEELSHRPGYFWVNQYASESNRRAHLESTGPELSRQVGASLRWLVCSIGSGGTACGLAAWFARQNPAVSVVAVEPWGSTIFGTHAAPYLSVGAGLHEPSAIVKRWGSPLAAHAQVPDSAAISEVKRFQELEGIALGITSGACLAIARQLAASHPGDMVVALSADYGTAYRDIIDAGQIIDRYPFPINSLK